MRIAAPLASRSVVNDTGSISSAPSAIRHKSELAAKATSVRAVRITMSIGLSLWNSPGLMGTELRDIQTRRRCRVFKQRKKFTAEFKRDAVRRMLEDGIRSAPSGLGAVIPGSTR
jgi:hypothetical protein